MYPEAEPNHVKRCWVKRIVLFSRLREARTTWSPKTEARSLTSERSREGRKRGSVDYIRMPISYGKSGQKTDALGRQGHEIGSDHVTGEN